MACCLVPNTDSNNVLLPEHQTITWTNIDLSQKEFCGIHLKAISQKVLTNLIHNMCLEITLLKSLPYPPGGNGLIGYSKRVLWWNITM